MSTPPPDGSVKDGRTVVWFPQAHVSSSTGSGGGPTSLNAAEKKSVAKAQAAALESAAAEGVPFCEECEAARRKLRKPGATAP